MAEKSIIELLDGLNGELLAADPCDADDIMNIGVHLEELAGMLAASPDAVTGPLEEALMVLQLIHAGQVADPATATERVAEAISGVTHWLSGKCDATRAAALAEASDALRAMIAAAEGGPADAATTEEDDAPADADEADKAEDAEPPVAEEDADAADVSDTDAGAPAEEPESGPEPAGDEAGPAPAAPPAAQDWGFGEPVLPDDTDPDILKEFVVECLDHITNAEGSLLSLESEPDDGESVNAIFRAFHTIKGTSGFLGLDRIQKLAHLAENLLDRARDGEIRITGGYADLALDSCDSLREMIEPLAGIAPGGGLPVPDGLEALLVRLSNPEEAGVSDQGDTEPMRLGDILVGQGAAERESIERTVGEQGERPLGEELVRRGEAKAAGVAKALRTQKGQAGGRGQGGAPGIEATVRVNTSRLDSLINMVGELVIAQSMVTQDPAVVQGTSTRLQRNVSHAGKIIRELQDLTMSLRMIPLKGTFQKMARLVRDLSRKSSKDIRLVTEGEETEIDRSMVEVLNDPLVHMIRNSVDHGIEPVEQRAESGKPPTGAVTLRAYHSAGNVVIELRDDGQGLPREKILAKAIDRGLVSSGRTLSDSEVFGLIFHPGFSTAEQVTDISGRGVGMDVVKKSIESLRGRIEVHSTPGEGSVFTLRLPLTMAITDAMLLRVGEEQYLLPTVSIEQSFRPTRKSLSTVSDRGEMVMLRGELLPLFRLHELFDVPEAETDPCDGLLIAIESEGRRCALMVDELLGQHQVVVKSLGSALGHIPGIAGGSILGDGRVGLILDASGLLKLATQQAAPVAAAVGAGVA